MYKKKVRAAMIFQQGEGDIIQYGDIDLDSPANDEVLVKVCATGLCRSDLHYIRGLWKHPLPMVLGHEASGVIEDVGPGVSKNRIGEKVILSFSPGCGVCRYCALGQTYNCDVMVKAAENGTLLDGTTRFHLNKQDVYHEGLVASWSQYTVVPSKGAVPFTNDISFEMAALLGCAVTAGIGSVLNVAKVRPADSVVVFGCGGVGLNIIQASNLVRAFPIIAVDINPNKKDEAIFFGATHFVNASQENPVEASIKITMGGADFSFEAIGNTKTAELAYRTTRRGGTTVLVGQPSEEALAGFPPYGLTQYDRKILGSMVGSVRAFIDYPKILKLAEKGFIKLGELITYTMPLSEINNALKKLETETVNRIILIPD